jgi:HPt (histidine-containing phosphotransfer) domain-containing protein
LTVEPCGQDESPDHALAATPPDAAELIAAVMRRAQKNAAEDALISLVSVSGLSVARGLAALSGNAVKYLELLGSLVESHADDMTLLEGSLSAGDHAAALLLVHTLKGAGATLGVERLAAVAGRLESRLRTSPQASVCVADIRSEIEAINHELATLSQALSPLSMTLPALADLKTIDSTALKSVFDELEKLLGQGDAAAIVLFEEHAAELRTTLGPPGEKLGRKIKSFAFEDAREMLRILRQTGR